MFEKKAAPTERVVLSDDKILKAAKIPENSPINASVLIGAILCDNEVRDRVLDIVVEEHLLEALGRVRDYPAFHKRIGVPQPAPAPVKPKITWHIEEGYIVGKRDGEKCWFGPGSKDVVWYGEKIPEYVFVEYERQARLLQAQREADEAAKQARNKQRRREGLIVLDDMQP